MAAWGSKADFYRVMCTGPLYPKQRTFIGTMITSASGHVWIRAPPQSATTGLPPMAFPGIAERVV